MGSIAVTIRVRDGRTLVAATSVKFSNAGGTAGVVRNDTGAVVVADGTDLPPTAETGVYIGYIPDAIAGVVYTYYVEVVLNGKTYRDQDTATLAIDSPGVLPTNATTQLIETMASATNKTVIDGTTTEKRTAGETIALDKYLRLTAANEARRGGSPFARQVQLTPPGANGL